MNVSPEFVSIFFAEDAKLEISTCYIYNVSEEVTVTQQKYKYVVGESVSLQCNDPTKVLSLTNDTVTCEGGNIWSLPSDVTCIGKLRKRIRLLTFGLVAL